ncbi:hypothetical protein C8R44DRAFT_990694 [Mycena epipterygia]|nr:hypothetical protein C8R44DRAFT_990694 [Mycena epipterygia]
MPASLVPPKRAPLRYYPSTPGAGLHVCDNADANRHGSKSLSVGRPLSVASHATFNSASTLSSGGGGPRSVGCLLGLGSPSEKERERQHSHEAERDAPSAAELLNLARTCQPPDTERRRLVLESARQPTERVRRDHAPAPALRAALSASTSPTSPSHSSSSYRARNDTGAPTLNGWFAHIAESTSDLSDAARLVCLVLVAQARFGIHFEDTLSSNATTRKEGDSNGRQNLAARQGRTNLLDGDAAIDRSAEPIWFLGVQLPGWGPEDESRVGAASSRSCRPRPLHTWPMRGFSPGSSTRRGALHGARVGKSAIRMLIDVFPACALGVSVATDRTLLIYQTEVSAASCSPPRPPARTATPRAAGAVWLAPHGARGPGGRTGCREVTGPARPLFD